MKEQEWLAEYAAKYADKSQLFHADTNADDTCFVPVTEHIELHDYGFSEVNVPLDYLKAKWKDLPDSDNLAKRVVVAIFKAEPDDEENPIPVKVNIPEYRYVF